MKKSLLFKKLFVLIAAIFTLWQLSAGQALLVENFDYPAGALLTANGWTASSGAGSQAIDVIVPGLTFPGYPSSVSGGAAQLDNTGEDVKKTFTAQTSGAVYASALVKVVAAADGYFFHLIGTDNFFRAKIFLVGNSFGLSLGANTGTTATESAFTIGTTYLMVVKYQIIDGDLNNAVSLYMITGSIPATEPTTPTIGPLTDGTSTASDINPTAVALRQYSASQNIQVDGIRIATNWTDAISDIYPPVPSFNPANSTVGAGVNVTPTITFDESIRNINGSVIVDGDLTSLITFKKTNASGDNVAFSASIDATKKVITLTPSSSLDNSQIYYLAVGAVEDVNGNETTASDITFTTIAIASPTITLTYPAGGEVMYAGQAAKITWTSENVSNVFIEVFGPDNDVTRVFGWMSFVPTTSAAAGTVDIIVPPDAPYGTVYRIRISDIDNPSVVSTGGDFTVISVATSLSELRTGFAEGYIKLNDIVKLSSEVIITFKAPSSNIYAQDAGAGILLYDSGSKMTGYNEKDGVTGLTGTIATFNNILEMIPNASPGAATSTNNTIAPVILTASSLNTNYDTYESMLIKINDVTFADAGGTFAPSTSYNITDVSGATVFYTKFNSADYIGTPIPSGLRNVTGICLQYNTTGEIASRNLLDFEAATGIESTSDQQAEIYPIPATSELKVRNIMNVKTINILDMTGKVIRTTNAGTENEMTIPVSDLKSGIYFIRFNTKNGSAIKRFVK